MRWCLIALAVASFGACKHYPTSQELANTPAPSLDVVMTDIDAHTCDRMSNQYAFGGPKGEGAMPAPVAGCSAYFPKYLLNASIQGNCASMFDLDDSGRAINLQTRCNVGSSRTALPEGWEKLAEDAFAHAAERQLASWRYPAKGAEKRDQRRHSIYVCTIFALAGQRQAPTPPVPFQRAGPAPPLPVDLLEKINEAST
jgi:hypothetical protein